MKATFNISIEHDNEYTALSNMNVNSKDRVSNSRTLTTFAESVRMPTYLVAYIVSDFSYLEDTTGKFNNITVHAVCFLIFNWFTVYCIIFCFTIKLSGVPPPPPPFTQIKITSNFRITFKD